MGWSRNFKCVSEGFIAPQATGTHHTTESERSHKTTTPQMVPGGNHAGQIPSRQTCVVVLGLARYIAQQPKPYCVAELGHANPECIHCHKLEEQM